MAGKTKRLDNKDWPFFQTTKSGLCCYVVTVNSMHAASKVIADAETKPNYVRRTRAFELPKNKIQVYLYFRQS